MKNKVTSAVATLVAVLAVGFVALARRRKKRQRQTAHRQKLESLISKKRSVPRLQVKR